MWEAGSPGMGLWVALCLANKITIVDHTALDSCRCLLCYLFLFLLLLLLLKREQRRIPLSQDPVKIGCRGRIGVVVPSYCLSKSEATVDATMLAFLLGSCTYL